MSHRPVITGLRVENVSKRYGGLNVVREIGFELEVGEILGIIGANGAGKTTLVNLITGVDRMDSGSVSAVTEAGVSITRHRMTPGRAVKMRIARTFQAGRLYPGMTVDEHVSMISGVDADSILRLLGLEADKDTVASNLGYGDQRLVEIGRALATLPNILILDEPAAGMTAEEAAQVGSVMRELASNGMAVLVIDHNVAFMRSICDRLLAMDFGQQIAYGSTSDVLADAAVVRAYLGDEQGVSGNGLEVST